MTSDTFSMRWGVDVLDKGSTSFPNHFWRVYSQILSKEEWLFICHLATYKYESVRGECRPSLQTVAAEMGYKSVRSVQKLRASLESRTGDDGAPLLVVRPQTGAPNVYDFSGLSRLLLALTDEPRDVAAYERGESQFTPEPQCGGGVNPSSPPPEPQYGGGVNPSSPEEEKQEEKQEEKRRETPDLRRLWQRCLTELAMQTTPTVFAQWYANTRLLSLQDGIATLAVRSEYVADWIEHRLARRVLDVLGPMTGLDPGALALRCTVTEPVPRSPPPARSPPPRPPAERVPAVTVEARF